MMIVLEFVVLVVESIAKDMLHPYLIKNNRLLLQN